MQAALQRSAYQPSRRRAPRPPVRKKLLLARARHGVEHQSVYMEDEFLGTRHHPHSWSHTFEARECARTLAEVTSGQSTFEQCMPSALRAWISSCAWDGRRGRPRPSFFHSSGSGSMKMTERAAGRRRASRIWRQEEGEDNMLAVTSTTWKQDCRAARKIWGRRRAALCVKISSHHTETPACSHFFQKSVP